MSRKLIVLVLVSVLLAPVALAGELGVPQFSWSNWFGWLWSVCFSSSQQASEVEGGEAASTLNSTESEHGTPTEGIHHPTDGADTTSDGGAAIDIDGLTSGRLPWS